MTMPMLCTLCFRFFDKAYTIQASSSVAFSLHQIIPKIFIMFTCRVWVYRCLTTVMEWQLSGLRGTYKVKASQTGDTRLHLCTLRQNGMSVFSSPCCVYIMRSSFASQ